MKYYFIEDFDSELNITDGEIISLTPQCSYELTNRGISYKIFEEFYNEKELRKDENGYFLDQLKWFDEFDLFLKRYINYCFEKNINLAKESYGLIKYFVDSVVIQAFITRALIHKIDSGHIIYVRTKNIGEKKKLDVFLYGQKGALFQYLIPLALKQNNAIRFSLRDAGTVKENQEFSKTNVVKEGENFAKFFLKHLLRYCKYVGTYVIQSYWKERGARVLFLHSNSPHLDPVIKNFIRKGSEVFCLFGRVIHRLDLFNPFEADANVLDLKDSQDTKIREDCQVAALMLATEGKGLLDWIDNKCQFDVSELVLPYLQDFVSDSCFQMLMDSRCFGSFYEAENIDYVVTHTNSDLASKSALIAARVQKIESICIQHGCDVFIDRAWQVTDIDSFDWYVAMDSLSKEKFSKYTQSTNVRTSKVLQSSHYLKLVKANSGNFRSRLEKVRRTILYIPTKLLVHQRYFNCMIYPACWYFEYQKKLMEFFYSKKSQYLFIYKHAVTRVKYADESIIPYIEDKKFENIYIQSGSVMKYLKKVDAVILDRPTTAFYESLISGLPVLALYPDFIEGMIDENALLRFGKCLQKFSSFDESFKKIEELLDRFQDNLSPYIQTLPIGDDQLLDFFINRKK